VDGEFEDGLFDLVDGTDEGFAGVFGEVVVFDNKLM